MESTHLLAALLTALPMLSSAALGASALPLPNTALESGELKLGLAGGYTRASKNFNLDGSTSTLPDSHYFRSLTGTLFTQYGATKAFTFIATLEGVSNTAQAQSWHTTSGTGEGEIGLRWQPEDLPVRIILDAGLGVPLYSRLSADNWASASSDSPFGNGTTELGLSATAEMPLATGFFLGGTAGYASRSSGFSALLLYRGYLKYEDPASVFARLGIAGQATLIHDQFAEQALSPPKDRALVAEAGSAFYNTIDPTFVKLDAALGVYVSSVVFLSGGLQLPLSGKNTIADPTFSLSLGFDWGAKPQSSGYEHSNRGFQQYYLSAKVIAKNGELHQILIDKGKGDGVQNEELLDIFMPDNADGSFGETVARGKVIETGPTRSKIKVLEDFKNVPIQEGFMVRRPVH